MLYTIINRSHANMQLGFRPPRARRNCGLLIGMALSFFAAVTVGPVCANPTLNSWFWRNPLPQGTSLLDTEYIDNAFLSVGGAGVIYSSAEGLKDTGFLSELLRGVAFGNNTIVVVGNYGTIITSTDGDNWILRSGPEGPFKSCIFKGIAFGNNTFVAIGSENVCVSVDNGISWQLIPLLDGMDAWFNDVTFANGLFVAVGDQKKIFTSIDGLNWTDRSIDEYTWGPLENIVYGDGVFMIISRWGAVFTSPDTLVWTYEGYVGKDIYGVAYGNQTFVAVGEDGSINASQDRKSWATHRTEYGVYLHGVEFACGKFVVVGDHGRMYMSSDGIHWTDISATMTTYSLLSVAYGNNRFIAVDYGGELFTSVNGRNWRPLPSLNPRRSFIKTRFVKGMFYLFCRDVLLASKDGRDWVTIPLPDTVAYDLIYAEGLYVCVGSNQTVLTSPDLTNWSPTNLESVSAGMSHGLVGVAYGDGKFVVVGNRGTAFFSEDATSWENTSLPTPLQCPDRSCLDSFRRVAYGADQFVVLGYYGSVYSSPDGKSWANRAYGHNSLMQDMIYTPDGFLAVGTLNRDYGRLGPDHYAQLYHSSDGITWTVNVLPVNQSPLGTAYGKNSYIIVGTSGTILQSDNPPMALPWIPYLLLAE